MHKKLVRSILTFLLIVALVLPLMPTRASAAYENTYKNTGNMRNDIIGVALTQVGYREGSNNYTKYGKWYGSPNSPWCGMFVSWCAKQAGVPTSILKKTGIANPKNFGLSYKSGSSYTPKKGDLFFKKSFTHVGFVYYTEGDYFYTIEGNTSTSGSEGHSVMIRKRKISDFYFSSPKYGGTGSSSSSGCSHKYETKYATAHPHKEYKICSKCDKKTYTGKTKSSSTCKTCIQASCDHDYSTWKNTSDSKHSKVCSKCDKKVTAAHDWETGKILKEATCVDKGSRQLICADCGAESKKTIQATGEHKYGDFSYVNESKHQKVCSTCGKQTTSKHTVSKKWDNDSIYHWTSCADCEGRIQHSEHVFSEGCLSPCDTCGYIQQSGHKLPDLFTYDEESHWKICSRCDEKAESQMHTYTSDCDEVCNDCGYKRIAPQLHQDVYHADETGHWRRCTSCTRVTDIVSHMPDQDAEEWDTQFCVQCKYELRSGESHIHTFATVESDTHNHWGSCVCGQILEPQVHTWDFQTGACSICGAENTATEGENTTNLLVTLWNRIFK